MKHFLCCPSPIHLWIKLEFLWGNPSINCNALAVICHPYRDDEKEVKRARESVCLNIYERNMFETKKWLIRVHSNQLTVMLVLWFVFHKSRYGEAFRAGKIIGAREALFSKSVPMFQHTVHKCFIHSLSNKAQKKYLPSFAVINYAFMYR